MKESPDIDALVEILWEYHHMHHQLKKVDCIFVLGSNDTRVANYAVDLYFQELAPYILFSGGLGRFTTESFAKSEAETFADIARARGVPEEKIILEDKSANTGENVEFSKEILKRRGLDFSSFILVQKPFMERRSYATFKKVWPEKDFIVTSPPIPFKEYPTDEIPRDKVINTVVGDLERIQLYPEKGFQIYQEIPPDVWEAYEKLVRLGYDEQLIRV
jgi:uncharacterized SAM-binding protein YcdF (DUF218 family)